jgi:hypothetical protein
MKSFKQYISEIIDIRQYPADIDTGAPIPPVNPVPPSNPYNPRNPNPRNPPKPKPKPVTPQPEPESPVRKPDQYIPGPGNLQIPMPLPDLPGIPLMIPPPFIHDIRLPFNPHPRPFHA